jgi:membrane protein required for colicin V production
VNWLDFVIVGVIGLITYRAYANGFIRELVSLSAVILAIPVAGIFFDDLFPKIEPIVDDARLASLVSFLAIFLAVIIGGLVAAHLLRGGVRLLNLGAVDSIAGGTFGFLKGVLVVQAVLLACVLFPKPDAREPIDESTLSRRLLDGSPIILAFLPDSFERDLYDFMDNFREVTNNTVGTLANWE